MRDMMFDGFLEAEEQARVDDPGPRKWSSVYDIPPGTVVTCKDGQRLYVNTRGLGWWVNGAPISEGERLGWTISDRHDSYGPFVETEP